MEFKQGLGRYGVGPRVSLDEAVTSLNLGQARRKGDAFTGTGNITRLREDSTWIT